MSYNKSVINSRSNSRSTNGIEHSRKTRFDKTNLQIKISMQINGEPYKVNCILTKGFKFEVLLGPDFIYEHNANVMIIKKKVILLRCKSELPHRNLLEITDN